MSLNAQFLTRSALACAALAACGFAQAQSNVTLYGIVSQDYVHASNTPTGKVNRLDDGKLNSSRLGFKGSEDLGGGLTAVFGLESGLSPDTGKANGGTTFWDRGSYVGVASSSLGSLTFGRQWNVNDDVLGNFFIFGGYAVFSYGGFGATSDIYNNSVKYVSPSYAGFSVEALATAGEGGASVMELAGAYNGEALKAALTYHETKAASGGAKDKLTAAGISYALGAWNARLGYAHANNAYSGTGTTGFNKAASYDLGLDYAVTPVSSLSLDYVARNLKDSSDDSHFIRLLGKYNLSKRTQLNANIVTLKNKGTAVESFYGIDAPGGKQTVLGVGVSHSF
jgi:predicted porin